MAITGASNLSHHDDHMLLHQHTAGRARSSNNRADKSLVGLVTCKPSLGWQKVWVWRFKRPVGACYTHVAMPGTLMQQHTGCRGVASTMDASPLATLSSGKASMSSIPSVSVACLFAM